MKTETLNKMMPVVKIKTFPVYAALYEMRGAINEHAPKIGRQKGEKIFDLINKLENEIDELVADEKDI